MQEEKLGKINGKFKLYLLFRDQLEGSAFIINILYTHHNIHSTQFAVIRPSQGLYCLYKY